MIELFTIAIENDVNPSHGQLYNDHVCVRGSGHTDVRENGGLYMTLRRSNYFLLVNYLFLFFFIKG